jgi:hypothetical protein
VEDVMKKLITIGTLLGLVIGGLLPAKTMASTAPRVEVVFVLDTTGSMGGLIEGAKQKIWWIANQIVGGEPTPEIEVGLVAYRDKGDEYVTRIVDLNDDLDAVYGELMSFRAQGGGDSPEHVNRALHEAVHGITWSDDDRTLKIIFLVGDAPPHTDYADQYDYKAACREAVLQDIIVNTIQCGLMSKTTPYWQEIARLGEGEYAAVEQSGGMRVIGTPVDDELALLSRDLDGTAVFYGDASVREAEEASLETMAALEPGVAADRADFKARGGRISASDLVDAIREGDVLLESIDAELLPDELRGMSNEERQQFLDKRAREREEIRKKIAELTRERDAYIAEKIAAAGAEGSFDAQVLRMIRTQALEKGIDY